MAEIDRLFLLDKAATIKAIPLSLLDQTELPFWPYSREGVFSVKSGYHRLMELEDTKLNGATNDGITSPVWKAIWRMNVPNRVKSLVWRAGRNALPTRMNMVRRHILTNAMCPKCKVQLEETLHALWSCLILQDVWKVSFSKLVTETGFSSSFLEVLELALADKSSLELFAMTISEIWQRQNKARVGKPTVPVC